MDRKLLKVGVWKGGGPPPGYSWHIGVLDWCHKEAIERLTTHQCSHIRDQVKDLASEESPSQSKTVDVRPIEDFHELRDKGGVLGNLNVRVFFFIDSERRTLVVLGVIVKKNDGATLVGDKHRMRRRLRKYRNGDFGFLSQRRE